MFNSGGLLLPVNISVQTRVYPSGVWSPASSYVFSDTQTSGCQSAFSNNSEVSFSWSSSNLGPDDYVIYKRGS